MSEKTTTDTTNKEGIIASKRYVMNRNMAEAVHTLGLNVIEV